MKILYVITRAEMGGSQVQVAHLLEKISPLHELALITGESGYLTEYAAKLGIHIHVVPDLVQPLRPKSDVRAFRKIYRIIRHVRPDLLHCHTSKAGIIGRAAARLARVPSVYTAHTWSFAEGTSAVWKFVGIPAEWLASRWSERVIAVSRSNEELALRKRVVPPRKITTVYNGIPDTRLKARPGDPGIPAIVMVARFSEQKNQAELLRALARVRSRFRLTFVGNGPTLDSVRILAYTLGLGDCVEFSGERRDTDAVFAAHQVFVLATNWEGFPLTILEAMRAGLPVIATDVNGVSEAVADGITGYLYSKGDVEALSTAIERIIDNPSERIRFGEAGRARYEQEFGLDRMVSRTLEVYEQALSASPRAHPHHLSETPMSSQEACNVPHTFAEE